MLVFALRSKVHSYTAMLRVYTVFLLIPFCFSLVPSERKHQFIAIPAVRQKIPLLSNLTINCSTTDANATTAVYFRQRGQKQTWRLLKPDVDQIVKIEPQVYTLINVKHTGQYQCRSWKEVNGTIISWPIHAGKVKVIKNKRKLPTKKPKHGRRKNQGNKKSSLKKAKKVKRKGKLLSKKNRKKGRINFKKTGSKKSRGKKRRPGFKKVQKKRPFGKKHGNKKKAGKITKKKIEKKRSKSFVKLKTSKRSIHAMDGRKVYLNCVAKYQPAGKRFTLTWFKDGKLMGKPLPSYLSIVTKSKTKKRKLYSLIKIESFKTARDKGQYVCKASYPNGRIAASLAINVAPKS